MKYLKWPHKKLIFNKHAANVIRNKPTNKQPRLDWNRWRSVFDAINSAIDSKLSAISTTDDVTADVTTCGGVANHPAPTPSRDTTANERR